MASSTAAPWEVIPATQAGIGQVAEALREGRLVVLPTETVYGLGVNLMSAGARESARQIKARLADMHSGTTAANGVGGGASPPNWVVHVSQPEELISWAPHLSPLARRLVSKALPGPVAFQVKLSAEDLASARTRLGAAADETLHDGYLTLRCPELAVSQQVLKEAGVPVAIIGVGTTTQPGIFELGDVSAEIISAAHGIGLALDAGPTRYRKSSTLVRIEGEAFSVVRSGVIDERIIRRFADFTILFICSGNTCRSPMAAALAMRILADRLGIRPAELPLRHIVVQSAGLHAARGMRAAVEAMETVKGMGADLTTHFSQPASVDLLRRADVIYTMTQAQREEVLALLPGAEKKTFRLDPEADVADPIGSGLFVYQQVANRLVSLLEQPLYGLPL